MAEGKRDPQRRESILVAATELLAERGFPNVSMAEIGARVGIAASAIYWHFSSKQDLLVALFDRCLDVLLREQAAAIDRYGPGPAALRDITRQQVEFVVRQRALALVYYREANHLPKPDLTRLRRKQREYVMAWTAAARATRPQLTEPAAEDLVHAAIGAVQSSLVHRSRLPRGRLEQQLVVIALRVLETPVVD